MDELLKIMHDIENDPANKSNKSKDDEFYLYTKKPESNLTNFPEQLTTCSFGI